MLWLEGYSVVVTGAGSGIGRAIVDRFVAEGASVVAFDKNEDKLKGIKEACGGSVEVVAGDVRDYEENRRACEVAVEAFGKLDTFVGNAGLWDFSASLEETSPDELAAGFNELFGVNVKGYLLGAKAALPMLRASGGSIILSLSNAAFYPRGGGPLYIASKHAGAGLVKQLAYELAPTVRVNGVAPGGANTDLRGPVSLGLGDTAIGDRVPIDETLERYSAMKIAATPEDYVAPYVLLAAKSQSRVVTGAVFDVSSVGTPMRAEPGEGGEPSEA